MRTFLVLASALSLAAAGGCATGGRTPASREPYVKPGLILLTADQAERRGIDVHSRTSRGDAALPSLDPLDANTVVAPEGVKVYALNRAVDPADRELMHEAHVVYRRETSPQWRLSVPSGQRIQVGPQVLDGRQELQPIMSQELTAFLVEQRKATSENQKAITALFKAVESLSEAQRALAEKQGRGSRETPESATEEQTGNKAPGETAAKKQKVKQT